MATRFSQCNNWPAGEKLILAEADAHDTKIHWLV